MESLKYRLHLISNIDISNFHYIIQKQTTIKALVIHLYFS